MQEKGLALLVVVPGVDSMGQICSCVPPAVCCKARHLFDRL